MNTKRFGIYIPERFAKTYLQSRKEQLMSNRHIAGLAVMLLVIVVSVMPVFAGDINAAEQTIIDYCNGTVAYNGKNYRFTEAAKQQVYNKLTADDVDLTAAQAASAIRQVNANIQQGIEQGYLVEVSEIANNDTEHNVSGDTEFQNTETSGEESVSSEKGTNTDSEEKQDEDRPVYSDAKKVDLASLLKEALGEGKYSTMSTNPSQSSNDQFQDGTVTVEQFLKGTVKVVTKDGDMVLSAGLPIKNTGYYNGGMSRAAALVCILCGFLVIAVLRKEKSYISIPVFLSVTGIAAFVAFGGGFLESEAGKWKAVWISGAPEYVYGAEIQNSKPDNDRNLISLLPGEQYGEILCEDIDLQTPLYYGDTEKILKQGAGTYAGRSLPGQGGEILVGGHDTTFFAPLKFIREGMLLTLKTKYGEYQYKVTDTEVLDVMEYEKCQSKTEELVLYTCYPFGAEEKLRNERFFVYAEKVFNPEIGE